MNMEGLNFAGLVPGMICAVPGHITKYHRKRQGRAYLVTPCTL